MFFNSQVDVVRKNAGSYNDDGVWVDGTVDGKTETTFKIIANVQPLNQRESEQYTQVLGFGNRTILLVKIYTNAELKLDEQTGTQKADVITWLGRDYKIAMKEEWQSNIINHYRYIGVEVNGSEFNN